MENLNHYNRIQDFISGKLSNNQQDKFKSDLNEDPDLKLEYKAALAADQAIELLVDQRLKRKFQTSNKSDTTLKVTSSQTKKRPWLKMAAAITFLVVSAIIIFLYLGTPTHETLAQEGFTEPPLLSLRTPSRGQNQTPLSIGEYAYDQEDLNAAAKVLADINPKDKDFNMAQLTLGATYFKQKEYDLAIAIFTQLASDPNNSYQEQANWNLAMTYLSKKDIPKARQLLQKIDNEGNVTKNRKEKLKKILEQL